RDRTTRPTSGGGGGSDSRHHGGHVDARSGLGSRCPDPHGGRRTGRGGSSLRPPPRAADARPRPPCCRPIDPRPPHRRPVRRPRRGCCPGRVMTVIGTAGHVDHGKSTLLQAITGRDPDRWEEEKRRGLTIDLGFVWGKLPSGREISFVDVPGHERFIKNMLAGIEAIDAALFVVAADEGWMPQSEEHLAVLDLLDVRRGVVALTKADLVDDELLELVTLEVHERLEGSSLEGAPVLAVSSRTGDGLDDVIAALDAIGIDGEAGDDPRLWIDRRFTVSGAGTVVTGTLLGGPLRVGDILHVHPGHVRVRVRALESHEREHQRVDPHRRVAVNLADAPEHLARGAMLG